MMKAAAVKSNKPNESRAAANSIFQQKTEKKRASGIADNQRGPAAGRLKSVPNGAAGSSTSIRLFAPSPVSPVSDGNNGKAGIRSGGQEQLKTGRSSIQRKWIPHDEKESSIKLMRWDEPIDGKTWFSVEGEDLLFYRDGRTESERKPYLQWLKEGWLGLTDSALARDAKRDVWGGVDPRAETEEESFIKMVNQGRALYSGMGPTERLKEKSPDWGMYHTKPEEPEGGQDPVYKSWGTKVCVKTGFKDTYFNRLTLLKHKGTGHYQNYFYFPSGTVVASANYRAAPEEREPLSNSEVLYHQLLEAAAVAKEKPQMKTLIRDHVVNETLQPIIRRVRNERGKGDLTFEPGDPIFFVLLTTPNVKTGVFLVNDRGHLIGIETITKLVLLGKGSVEIHFG